MKKQIIAFLLLLVVGAQFTAHLGYTKAQANASIEIPNEAIRLRILANSDAEKDQALKRKVRDRVKAQIDSWVEDLKSFEDARRVIQSRLPELEQTVAEMLKEEGSKQSYKVEFGKHVKFPTKVYGNFIYPAGEYEAVLVTLGEGEGANWWCVLFPPLCFLDFASGTAVAKEKKAVKAEPEKEEAAAEQPEEEAVEAEPKQEVKKGKKTAEVKRISSLQEEKILKELEESMEEEMAEEPVEQELVKEEPETEVKFFFVEAFQSLFSR